MRYPLLTPQNVSRDMIDVFGGYNHNLRIGDNEFYDMNNLSSDSYPLLGVRKKRSLPYNAHINQLSDDTDIRGILYSDKLYTVRRIGNQMFFCVGNTQKAYWNSDSSTNNDPRTIIPMGSRMIVMPDKKVINLADENPTAQDIDNIKEAEGALSVQPCLQDGTVLTLDYVGDEIPVAPIDGFVWLDTRSSPASLKKYYASQGTWQSFLSSYVKISSTNTIAEGFKVGDGVKIEKITIPELEVLNNTSIVKSIGIDSKSMVVTGIIDPMPNRYILSAEYTQESQTIHFLSDDQLEANLFANKRMMINNKMYSCTKSTAGTAATAMPIYSDVQLSNEGITLTAVENPTATNIIYVTNTAFGSGDLSRQQICFGDINNREFATILGQGTTANGGRYLVIDQNVAINANNKTIRPITYIVPEGLYKLDLIFSEAVKISAGDKACPTLDNQYTQAYDSQNKVKFSREMPEMGFVIESQNRLWGCNYKTSGGESINEIYCSKLGDPTNWRVYEGISTDSFAASVGTEGEWTGAFNYRGYPTFFKEHHIHTVYGSNPPYQIKDVQARGIQKGSSNSLAMVNEVLFYKSLYGVCAYTGGLPEEISSPLGGEFYKDAVGCSHRGKYYIEMANSANNKALFIYDTTKGLWHKEAAVNAIQMVSGDSNVLYTVRNTTTSKTELGRLFEVDGHTSEGAIRWYAETGIFGLASPDKKYISRLNLRLMLPVGSAVFISIQYDSSGVWERVTNLNGHSLMPFTMAIKPRRCDHFRIKLEGIGDMKLYSISKTIEMGSDR